MKKSSFIVIFLMFSSFILTSCNRAIPLPGGVTVSPVMLDGKSGATGMLLGQSLYLTVTQASDQMLFFQEKRLLAKFELGNSYELWLVQARGKQRLSEGMYQYELDQYHVDQSSLTMFGKRGFNIHLTFLHQRQEGMFYAVPNDASIHGTLKGTFVLR